VKISRKILVRVGMILSFIVVMIAGCSNPNNEEQMVHGMKIAVISSPYGISNTDVNIVGFVNENPGSTVTNIKEDFGNEKAVVQKISDIVSDYDVIICCGYPLLKIERIARENPNAYFIVMNEEISDEKKYTSLSNTDNVYIITFKEQEAGFLAGVAAALETKTGKVAVVNGIAYPSNINYQYGFESGVQYANKYYDANAEIVEMQSYSGTNVLGEAVGGNYVGDFYDISGGKVLGEALIEEGADILFVAAGESGLGVFEAAKGKTDVYCIGCDVDRYDEVQNGENNIMLTSVLISADKNIEKQLQAIQEGSFQSGNQSVGIDFDSIGYVKTEGKHQLSAQTISCLEDSLQKMKTGEVIPASCDNGMTPSFYKGL